MKIFDGWLSRTNPFVAISSAPQAASIIIAVPFTVILFLMMPGLAKALWLTESKQKPSRLKPLPRYYLELWARLFVHGCTYVAEHMDVRERPAANESAQFRRATASKI